MEEGKLERGATVIVRGSGVRASGQQQLHAGAAAGRCRVHQRRFASVVSGLDVCPLLQQRFHRFDLKIAGHPVQRGIAIVVPGLGPSALIQQKL